jgi:hypothetical protein
MPPKGPPVGIHMLISTQSLLYGDVPIQCICAHCPQGIAARVEKKTDILSSSKMFLIWASAGAGKVLTLGKWSLLRGSHFCFA